MIKPYAFWAVYTEFLRELRVKELIEKHMPVPGSNRGYRAWNYIEPLMLMQYGGGRHIEDIREIAEDKDAAVMEAIRDIAYWRELKTEDGIMTERETGETQHVDVLISDIKMPNLGGAGSSESGKG